MAQGATGATGAINVRGLRELNRAFKRAPATLRKEWRAGQRSIAEPTRVAAERLAISQIDNLPRSPKWAGMRIGISQKLVYVAPKKRGIKRGPQKRPNLAPLLMDRAMQPALDRNEREIMRRFDQLLAEVGRDWER